MMIYFKNIDTKYIDLVYRLLKLILSLLVDLEVWSCVIVSCIYLLVQVVDKHPIHCITILRSTATNSPVVKCGHYGSMD